MCTGVMKTKAIGAWAPVTWTDERGGQEVALFIFGDGENELSRNADDIYGALFNSTNLDDVTVIEVSHHEWWDIKHCTNIGKGFYISRDENISLIEIPTKENL